MATPNARLPVTITTAANGLSASVDLANGRLVGIQMPDTWTAAALTFQASYDGITYADVYDGSVERNYTVAANRYLQLPISDWLGVRYVRLRSGTAGAPVQQGANRAIGLVTDA
jgi:hypothetical protein